MFSLFDHSFLVCLTLSNFNKGFKTFNDLQVMNIFKSKHIQPAEMSFLTAIINFPWCLKLFYGIIADNVYIFGSRRRNYIIINSILAFLMLLAMTSDITNNKYAMTAVLAVLSIN
jgi:uncharacterized protein with PQ loop repeat